MDRWKIEELSATTAVAANGLELRPGQESFARPTTYTEEEDSVDPTKSWSRVITQGNEVVGFIRAYFDSDHPRPELRNCIWRISVAAAHQGSGVGRFAVGAVVEEARRRGAQRLTVMWPPNAAGPGEFFRKLGFVEVGESVYGDTIGALAL